MRLFSIIKSFAILFFLISATQKSKAQANYSGISEKDMQMSFKKANGTKGFDASFITINESKINDDLESIKDNLLSLTSAGNSSTESLILSGEFLILDPLSPSTISSFNPKYAGFGDTVIITGSNFAGVSGVSFGGTPAISFVIVNINTIRAVVGNGTSGTLKVFTSTGGIDSLNGFVYCSAPLLPKITISSNAIDSVCPNTPIVFSATIVNGGIAPKYVWQKNRIVVGTNFSVYTDNSPSNKDTIICILTSNEPCASKSAVSSNRVVEKVRITSDSVLNTTNFNTFGSAVSNGNGCYRLTSKNGTISTGMIWYPGTVSLNKDFDFSFSVNQSGVADGLAFIMHNSGSNAYVNDGGSDLGYYGKENNNQLFKQSLAIEFDIYKSTAAFFDNNNSHISFVKNKVASPLKGPYPISPILGSGITNLVRITWSSSDEILTMYLNGGILFSHKENIISTIFGGNSDINFGFSGSIGGLSANQEVCIKSLIVNANIPVVSISSNVAFPVCPSQAKRSLLLQLKMADQVLFTSGKRME